MKMLTFSLANFLGRLLCCRYLSVLLTTNRTKECSADFIDDEKCTNNRFGGAHFHLTQGRLHHLLAAASLTL
ncbi:hypothetical protein TcWFU_009511 [Taenia crassiceps]|uniref:Secreted protein n=1 Tax=Taenia crassiceps TaxID=6207 RepID=A0ABR4QMY6_9CEST